MASIIFNNYDILVEVIKCIPENQVLVVIKDKGVGISSEDLPYIANIGSSADNEHKRKLMKNMPEWLQPSGLFGIGLQSVFQIADCIEFYTRQQNRPERRIALYSYGRNHGRIEVTEIVPEEDLVYYTNSIPGTNAKIIINPDKIYIDETKDVFFDSHKEKPKLLYFDNDFHNKCRLDIIFNEICEACKAVIRSSPSDYFRIGYQEIIQTTNKENGKEDNYKQDVKMLRDSYFINPEDLSKSDTGSKSSSSKKGSKNSRAKSKFVYGDNCIPYLKSKGKSMVFSGTTAFYWDNESSTAYHLTIRPCKITNIQNNGQVFLPRRTKDLYKIHYKFNTLSKTDSIYSFAKEDIQSHAGFISWDIYIFNNKQTKYLNIDRDQLKKGAITEDELLQIRSKILVEWCEYLIDANGNPDVDYKNAEYLLHNDDSILLSLLILFYQCCERNQFDRFIEKYGENISGRGLVIGHENILVTDLWNDSKRFFITLGYLSEQEGYFYECTPSDFNAKQTNNLGSPISLSTLHHFPHRLIQNISIQKYGERELSFSFRFAHTLSQNRYVEMDDYARMLDYIFTIRRRERKKQFAVKGIEKSVLKPDSKYPHLIVDRYPVTFQLNNSISHYLNECIKSYIISPFDASSLTLLTDYIKMYPDEKSGEPLINQILSSEIYSNCEKYILKHSIYGEISLADTPKWRALIKNEYTEFIDNFCRILHENMNEAVMLLAIEINTY